MKKLLIVFFAICLSNGNKHSIFDQSNVLEILWIGEICHVWDVHVTGDAK